MILHNPFDTNNKGRLTICGLDAVELSHEFGTPAIYISEDEIRRMCRLYKKAFTEYFGGKSSPVYAGKALCFKKLYSIMKEENMLADCVSSGELATAFKAGFPMENVFFHGNNKTDFDINYALDLGVGHIVVDGIEELLSLDTAAAEKKTRQKILLRITPGIDPHTHKKIITGNVDSKFGSAIATGQAEAIVRLALSLDNVELEGLHCHIGSQIFDIDPFKEAAEIMLEFIAMLQEKCGYKGHILNIGGGFGVRYTTTILQSIMRKT